MSPSLNMLTFPSKVKVKRNSQGEHATFDKKNVMLQNMDPPTMQKEIHIMQNHQDIFLRGKKPSSYTTNMHWTETCISLFLYPNHGQWPNNGTWSINNWIGKTNVHMHAFNTSCHDIKLSEICVNQSERWKIHIPNFHW